MPTTILPYDDAENPDYIQVEANEGETVVIALDDLEDDADPDAILPFPVDDVTWLCVIRDRRDTATVLTSADEDDIATETHEGADVDSDPSYVQFTIPAAVALESLPVGYYGGYIEYTDEGEDPPEVWRQPLRLTIKPASQVT